MKALRPPTRREAARSTAEYQRVAALLESVQRETRRRVPRELLRAISLDYSGEAALVQAAQKASSASRSALRIPDTVGG
jgi:hypothetical protein